MIVSKGGFQGVFGVLSLSAGLCLTSAASGEPRMEVTGGLPIFHDVALKVAPLQTSPIPPGTLKPKAGDGTAGIGVGTLDVKTLGSVKGGQKVDVPVALLSKEYANASGFQVVLKFDTGSLSTTVTGKKDGTAFANATDQPAQVKGDSVTYGASISGGTTTARGALAILSFTTASNYSGDTEISLQSVQVTVSGVANSLRPGASVVLSSGTVAGAGIPSDFDGNGVVDFDDFFLFAAAFGLKQGQAGFDAKYDLSSNGMVDFDDFFIFAGDFGKKK